MSGTDPDLIAIVAVTPSGVIGKDGDMPWRLSGDLRRFKQLTMGGTLIMGRRTYDSIGRPLPGRQTVVVTRQADWTADGVTTATDPLSATRGDGKRFVVGGAEIYRQLLPQCGQLWITRVWSSVIGDTHLEIDLAPFQLSELSRHPATAKDDVPTEFWKMTRRG